jgi:hypothetical protein
MNISFKSYAILTPHKQNADLTTIAAAIEKRNKAQYIRDTEYYSDPNNRNHLLINHDNDEVFQEKVVPSIKSTAIFKKLSITRGRMNPYNKTTLKKLNIK